MKGLGLFGQGVKADLLAVPLHLAETDRLRDIVNGDEIDLVLPLAIPPIADLRKLSALGELVVKVKYK